MNLLDKNGQFLDPDNTAGPVTTRGWVTCTGWALGKTPNRVHIILLSRPCSDLGQGPSPVLGSVLVWPSVFTLWPRAFTSGNYSRPSNQHTGGRYKGAHGSMA